MNLFLQVAAQSQQPAWMQFMPFVLIIVVFYFFMIRPQMKRQKELRKYREALKKGDKVITTGGMYGKVAEVKDDRIILEVADGVKLEFDKSAIVMDMSDAQAKR
ncbi:MAG: preprotein translocase subunit YajC [Breznakibacter sp.]|nr:preprotein translocase subunit YajC [Breznakibacter sp.]